MDKVNSIIEKQQPETTSLPDNPELSPTDHVEINQGNNVENKPVLDLLEKEDNCQVVVENVNATADNNHTIDENNTDNDDDEKEKNEVIPRRTSTTSVNSETSSKNRIRVDASMITSLEPTNIEVDLSKRISLMSNSENKSLSTNTENNQSSTSHYDDFKGLSITPQQSPASANSVHKNLLTQQSLTNLQLQRPSLTSSSSGVLENYNPTVSRVRNSIISTTTSLNFKRQMSDGTIMRDNASLTSMNDCSPSNLNIEELRAKFDKSQLRLARSEAKNEACFRKINDISNQAAGKNEACLRRINQLTQTLQFIQADKEKCLRAQFENIGALEYQVANLQEENQMFHQYGSGKSHGKGNINDTYLKQKELELNEAFANLDQQKRDLFQEMDLVKREQRSLMERREELEVQCNVLNEKLKSGASSAEKAMEMQSNLKLKLDEELTKNKLFEESELESKEFEKFVSEKIENFKKDVSEKDIEIEKLKDELKEKDMKIVDLEKIASSKTTSQSVTEKNTKDNKKSVDDVGKDSEALSELKNTKKELAKCQKELENEKKFIKTLKEKFQNKTTEWQNADKMLKKLQTESQQLQHKINKIPEKDRLITELQLQLDAANQAKTNLAQTVHQAQTHIGLMEENERRQIEEVNKICEKYDCEIFEWKRKLERARDEKTEALESMRKKYAAAQQISQQSKSWSSTAFYGLFGSKTYNNSNKNNGQNGSKQATLMIHCVLIGIVCMLIYDYVLDMIA